MTRFTLYNSIWRNAADALVLSIIALPFLLGIAFKGFWWMLPVFAMLALLAGAAWRRAFDRRVQLQIDEHGIRTPRYGTIAWADMREARIVGGKISYLHINCRNTQPWLAHAAFPARFLHRLRRHATGYHASFYLEHMGVDFAELGRFLRERLSVSTLAQQACE